MISSIIIEENSIADKNNNAYPFVLSDEVFPVAIDEDGAVVEITIENQRIYGNLRLTKVDKDYPDNKLTGAEFEVYRNSNGNKELDEGNELLGLMEEISTGIYEMTHTPT